MNCRLHPLGTVITLFMLATTLSSAQSGPARPPKKVARPAPVPAPVAAPVPLPVPFPLDEHLEYLVFWGPADAAALKFAIQPQQNLEGREAWHFQAKASTIKAARFLYSLDDQFDSYSDRFTLSSLQYEMKIREKSKKQDRVIRMSHEAQPAPPAGASVRVPVGTRDPLGLFYTLRGWDWAKTKEAVFPLYDGNKLYEVRAREVAAKAAVSVTAGSYTASRIQLRIFERGKELTGARFWISLADGGARLPVLIEAEVPFGKLRVELKSTSAK